MIKIFLYSTNANEMPKKPKLLSAPKLIKTPKIKTPKIKVVKGYCKSNGQFVSPYIKGLPKI
jgi:hypothetical protein